MDTLQRDLRHAFRGLVARPTYAVVVVSTLALVIGAATAVLAVVSATLIRPLPFPQADRLVQLVLLPPGQHDWGSRNPLTAGAFVRFRERLEQLDLLEGVWSRERVLGGDAEPEVVLAGAASPGMFALFGGRPALGRTFTEEEDRVGAPVAVLGHAIWRRRFGADPSIIGATLLIDREPHEVIGVMPPTFETGFVRTALWTPLHATAADAPSGATVVLAFGRLHPGATVPQLQAELEPVMQDVVAEYPETLTRWTALAVGLRDGQFRLQRPSLLALAGGVAALLLIACANLANLTLAQVLSRRRQLALRAALGGGRGALLRLQSMEALLLAAAGATAGVLVGRWMLPAVLALDPALSNTLGAVQVDWRAQAAAASAAALVALVAGLSPLLRELRGDPVRALGDGHRRSIGSPRDRRLHAILVASECALAVTLLACAALFLSAFDHTARTDPGFDPHDVLAAQLRLSELAYPTEADRADLIARVLDRLRDTPGVSSAGATLNRLEPGFVFLTRVHLEDRPTPDGQPRVVQFRRASPGYFATMRIPLLDGRDFSADDTLDRPGVAIVSRSFAERFWPGESAVGRRLRRGTKPDWRTVVGVVGDVSDIGLQEPPAPTVYVPFGQNNVAVTPVSLVLRTAVAPLSTAGAVRAAVLSVDPQQPIDSVTTFDRFLSASLGPQRFRSMLLLLLSGIGLALAALGVYGVTSRAVAERTAELGLRLALGGTPTSLARLVIWQSLRSVLAGLAVGAALAFAATRAMLRLLPDLEQAQSWMTTPAVLVLAAVAAVAAIVPARRALSLAPTLSLRVD